MNPAKHRNMNIKFIKHVADTRLEMVLDTRVCTTAFLYTEVSAIPALTIRSPLIYRFFLVFSNGEFRLSAYFGVVFPIVDRIRTKIVQNCQINVKMRTCNLTKIAKYAIFETFFGLEDNK